MNKTCKTKRVMLDSYDDNHFIVCVTTFSKSEFDPAKIYVTVNEKKDIKFHMTVLQFGRRIY